MKFGGMMHWMMGGMFIWCVVGILTLELLNTILAQAFFVQMIHSS